MPIVALRVDASAAIGLGHLQRCLALAQALRALDVTAVFVTRDLGLDAAARIAAVGFATHTLPPPCADDKEAVVDLAPPHAAWAGVAFARDAAQTVAALRHDGGPLPDWVVVDHYAFDARWHRAVADALGVRIAVIDDLADRPLQADLLIDHNLAESDHRTKYREYIGVGTTLLGGPRFALIGPAYANAPRCALRDPVRSIGIFMGGTDPAGLSELALRACREHAGFAGPVELVTTRDNPRHPTLQALAECWPHTKVSLDLPDLTHFFAEHDLQVGAGGGANWERCCIGSPALALVGAVNQLAVVPQLDRLGAVAALPAGEPQTAQAVGRALLALLVDAPRRHALSENARSLVDGKGARRVALRLDAQALRVRRASYADGAYMHRWRNDPVTRAVSRSDAAIPFDEHQRWLDRTLAATQRLLLVGEVGASPVGVVRFDRLDADSAEVSLFLDPAMHGLGLGTAMLRAGEAAACTWAGSGLRFVATVLQTNTGSRQLFESAGYRFVGPHGEKAVVASRPAT